ncbi:glycine-rich RNA-binding protein 4, mitochondrial-like [Bidens hawaiensis]|uniref:glycine-rich RNA-binding protein 4, mitochondrial-like n=1 Tax=Bidens hawaiensis TaxID=980011 RepID=UPI0040491362
MGRLRVQLLGGGDKALFWLDSWANDKPLQLLFPSLFVLEKQDDIYVNDCYTQIEQQVLFLQNAGLSKRTTDEGLHECFAKFGQVLLARVVKDRASGWSKGFGFVRYATLEEAAAGIEGMDGKFLDGWVIFAEYARPRDNPPPSPPSYMNNNQYGHRQ